MTITRVRWRERQRVSAADLRAEQLYRLEGLGRHFLAPHDWGVVRGLWLVPTEKRYSLRWQLLPGVAIDGYGRELLVREPIDLELPGRSGTHRVFLYYCEFPSSCPPCAPCRDDPAPRTRQLVQVVVSDTLSPITGPAADLALARAAGAVAAQPAWPVLVGTITLGGPDPVNAEVRYHAQRASILRSPSGGVALRQGLLGPDDLYHLLLSTSPDAASPVKRLGIDRDGIVHVWKQLVLTGPSASAKVALSKSAALMISAPTPAGALRRVLLKGVFENVAAPQLTLHRFDNSGAREVVAAALPKKKEVYHLDQTFRFPDMHTVGLKLVDTTKRANRLQVIRSVGDQPAFVVQQFDVELSPSGGRLALATRTIPVDATGVAPCDDDARSSDGALTPLEQGGVAYFLPAAQPTPAPLVRAIQTVTEQRKDGVPATAFRISGGEFDDGDHTPRIALGTRNTTAADHFGWSSAVTIDGGARVRMPLDQTVLSVSHTLQLPPITTNPSDPLTQDLLALAFNAGLRRAGRLAQAATFDVKLTPAANTVRRGDTLTYHIKTSGSAAATATVKRVLECVAGKPDSGEAPNADVTLRTVPELSGKSNIDQDVDIASFQHAAPRVVIGVEMLVTISGKDYVCSAVSPKIQVTD
jgi:hypothetical protein